MKHTRETEIEMVKRRIREEERRIAAQLEVIARLRDGNLSIKIAEERLATLEQIQADHRAHLARLMARV